MLNGIDISHHQLETPNLTGLAFAFARAGYGATADDRYEHHSAAIRGAKIVLGAYTFGVAHDSVADQVATLLKVGHDTNLYALDKEADGNNPPMTSAQAHEFIDRMHQAGKRCGLYHSESGFEHLGQDWNWVANWTVKPSETFAFWQDRGSPLDHDQYNGTLASLKTLAGITVPVVPVASPLIATVDGKPFFHYRIIGTHTVKGVIYQQALSHTSILGRHFSVTVRKHVIWLAPINGLRTVYTVMDKGSAYYGWLIDGSGVVVK